MVGWYLMANPQNPPIVMQIICILKNSISDNPRFYRNLWPSYHNNDKRNNNNNFSELSCKTDAAIA
jgi:hypothetical protein